MLHQLRNGDQVELRLVSDVWVEEGPPPVLVVEVAIVTPHSGTLRRHIVECRTTVEAEAYGHEMAALANAARVAEPLTSWERFAVGMRRFVESLEFEPAFPPESKS